MYLASLWIMHVWRRSFKKWRRESFFHMSFSPLPGIYRCHLSIRRVLFLLSVCPSFRNGAFVTYTCLILMLPLPLFLSVVEQISTFAVCIGRCIASLRFFILNVSVSIFHIADVLHGKTKHGESILGPVFSFLQLFSLFSSHCFLSCSFFFLSRSRYGSSVHLWLPRRICSLLFLFFFFFFFFLRYMVTSCFLSIRFFGVSVIWCCFAYWAFSPSCTFCSFVVDRHRRFFSSVCTFVRTFVRTFEINQQNLHKTNRATKIQLDFFSIASLLPPPICRLWLRPLAVVSWFITPHPIFLLLQPLL